MALDRDILERSIEAYGVEAEIDHTIEEMGELIVSLMELKRNNGKHEGRLSAVIDEIADVYICNARITAKQQILKKRINSIINGKESTHFGHSPLD